MRAPGRWTLPLAAVVGALTFPLAPVAGHASTRAYAAQFGDGTAATPAMLDALLLFAPAAEVYAFYGRLWIVAFLAFLAAALHLRARLGDQVDAGGARGLRLMLAGLAMNVIGNVGDYWLGRDAIGQILHGASFLATMLGLLVYMVGAALLARSLWRGRRLPRAVAVALFAAPLGFVVNALLVPNAPAAFMPPLAVGWIAVALVMARAPPAL